MVYFSFSKIWFGSVRVMRFQSDAKSEVMRMGRWCESRRDEGRGDFLRHRVSIRRSVRPSVRPSVQNYAEMCRMALFFLDLCDVIAFINETIARNDICLNFFLNACGLIWISVNFVWILGQYNYLSEFWFTRWTFRIWNMKIDLKSESGIMPYFSEFVWMLSNFHVD